MTGRQADSQQEAIVTATVNARLIVESGPGCGKTDVACARVAHLIGQGISGNRIVLLSFTRTAVREIKTRISGLAVNVAAAAEVDVRTLDSFAGYLRTSASPGVGSAPPGSYEEGVRQTLGLFNTENPILRETFEKYRHVIIDEAQDLVGDRAGLVRALLDALAPSCGWTLFLDPAQAIFDWSEIGAKGAGAATFVEHLAELEKRDGVQKRFLETIHRTGEKDLLTLMERARRLVLSGGNHATEKIRRLAFEHDSAGTPLQEEAFARLAKQVDATTLFLFRTRAEALEASRWLSKNSVAHRLRFGDLPYAIAPWIAAVVNAAARKDLTEAQFGAAWEKVLSEFPKLLTGWDQESAWRMLRKLGWQPAAKLVSVTMVAERLSQEGLPDDLVRKEIGTGARSERRHGRRRRRRRRIHRAGNLPDDEPLPESPADDHDPRRAPRQGLPDERPGIAGLQRAGRARCAVGERQISAGPS
jgi:hypothetical protein